MNAQPTILLTVLCGLAPAALAQPCGTPVFEEPAFIDALRPFGLVSTDWDNDGNGNFSLSKSWIAPGVFGVKDVITFDADGDSDLDVFTADDLQDDVLMWTRVGDELTGPIGLTGGQLGGDRPARFSDGCERLDMGDFDHDGDIDIVAVHNGNSTTGTGGISILTNTNGTFAITQNLTISGLPGEDIREIAIAATDWTTGAGSLAYYQNAYSSTVCAADITGDTILDIFDVFEFIEVFNPGDLAADFTGDGALSLSIDRESVPLPSRPVKKPAMRAFVIIHCVRIG